MAAVRERGRVAATATILQTERSGERKAEERSRKEKKHRVFKIKKISSNQITPQIDED